MSKAKDYIKYFIKSKSSTLDKNLNQNQKLMKI